MTTSPSSLAQARWRLLRAALLKETAASTDIQTASIHRYKEQQNSFFDKQEIAVDTQQNLSIRQRIVQQIKQHSDDDEALLEDYILLLQCCLESGETIISIECCQDKQLVLSTNLRERLARKGISCRILDDGSQRSSLLKIQFPPNNDYALYEYQHRNSSKDDDDNNQQESPPPFLVLYTRERRHQQSTTTAAIGSITSLMSQHYHAGVDNTGNTCIWDSELVLGGVLCEACHTCSTSSEICRRLNIPSLWDLATDKNKLRVLELGAGMAGLAGLVIYCMAKQQQDCRSVHLTLSDGHVDAVRHNRCTVRLNEITMNTMNWNDSSSFTMECKKLVWSDDIHTSPEQHLYDLLLCSDCTHFYEHHGRLFLTMATNLRVNGVVLMCQPSRGDTLRLFMNLTALLPDLLQVIHWWKSPEQHDVYHTRVYQRHVQAQQQQNTTYDPNIHYPQLVILQKRRNATENDRQRVLEHMKNRERRS